LDLVEELERVLAAFDAQAVNHALAGWLACAIHRRPFFTDMAEILVPEQKLRAARATHLEMQQWLTLRLRIESAASSGLWSRRVRASWRERKLTVISRDDLASGTPREPAAKRQFVAIRPTAETAAPLDISDEAISRNLERVAALYRLGHSLRDAKLDEHRPRVANA